MENKEIFLKECIKKACEAYCDNICPIDMSGGCYYKYDGKLQIRNNFDYMKCPCNELQIIRNEMSIL